MEREPKKKAEETDLTVEFTPAADTEFASESTAADTEFASESSASETEANNSVREAIQQMYSQSGEVDNQEVEETE